MTISQQGSYRLETNLRISTDATAIEITASGVTLDLNGFNIQGRHCQAPPTGPPCAPIGVGVDATNRSNGAVLTTSCEGPEPSACSLARTASSRTSAS